MARKAKKTATRRPTSRPKSGGGSGGGPRSRPPPAETAHARRIRLYLEKHPGATKAQARGHKPAEHQTRKQRAQLAGRLTEGERATVKRLAKQQARRNRGGPDDGEVYRSMLAWAQREGGGGFADVRALQAQIARLHRRGASDVRVRRYKDGTVTLVGDTARQAQNLDEMDDFASLYDVPDTAWLYYH